MYQGLFGFSKQVKEKHIGITEAPKSEKGVEIKLTTNKQPIKPIIVKRKNKIWTIIV